MSTRFNDSCQGDSGGPLVVEQAGGVVLAGLSLLVFTLGAPFVPWW